MSKLSDENKQANWDQQPRLNWSLFRERLIWEKDYGVLPERKRELGLLPERIGNGDKNTFECALANFSNRRLDVKKILSWINLAIFLSLVVFDTASKCWRLARRCVYMCVQPKNY